MKNNIQTNSFNRRQFLEAAGFTMSVAALNGCSRAPIETALPFAVQPEHVVPGRMQSYASTCAGCPSGCGLLVGVRDGRPLKMEGMPEHPLSQGGLCAVGQALPLGLYDSHRLSGPLADGKESDWTTVDKAITERLAGFGAEDSIVFVTPTVTSPTLQATIDKFLGSFAKARHVTFDAVSSSVILDAHEQTHGQRLLPRYRFDQASVIVSFGSDFLGTWISPMEFTAGWRSRRVPAFPSPTMSYHVQLEGRVSLTGTNADRRIRLAPEEFTAVLAHLATDLGHRAGIELPSGKTGPTPLSEQEVYELADKLWEARGTSLVVSDSQDIVAQLLINYINHALGNYGKTLDIEQRSRQRQGNDADVATLKKDLTNGEVAALFVAGTDLTHNLPNREELATAIKKVPLVVSFAERVDDFASLAQFVCPDHHALESWLDSEPIDGLISVTQPMLHPLRKTRSILESLHQWMEEPATADEVIKAHWRESILPLSKTVADFQSFWDKSVHDGFTQVDRPKTAPSEFSFDSITIPESTSAAPDFSLCLYSKIGMPDSRHAHNPWLQELPDPVTKVTWDNYLCMSPAAASTLGVTDGDLVRLATPNGPSVEVPTLVQRGQHDRVLSLALGYGVRGTNRFVKVGPQWLESRLTVAPDENVGKNAAAFIEFRDGAMQPTRFDVTLEKVKGRRVLASTQQHHSLEIPPNVATHGAEVRDIVQETTLAEFSKDPKHAGKPGHHDFGDKQLWAEDHSKTGHHWGLVVDQNCCTGCSACLVACQSENNVPVVGKDEVRRQREMHWIRIDRYYAGPEDDMKTAYQPMMCQHCDNAPCETVCPVLATVHGEEGLNEQAYNRCVGTRYCANNCPYKVRRFNWFTYEHEDDLQNLALNPDVTVRTRGVMEKCSMCVQRIEEGKLEAKRLGLPVEDGTIQTACQQSCPAQAIVFGDMNDPTSRVHAALQNPRTYGVLEEFNFRPSVSYLRVVRNRDDEPEKQKSTENGHHA